MQRDRGEGVKIPFPIDSAIAGNSLESGQIQSSAKYHKEKVSRAKFQKNIYKVNLFSSSYKLK